MKAGFIGLGNLGRAVAGRLAEQGVALTAYNRTRARAEAFAGEMPAGRVKVASTPLEAIESADVTFICLFDSDAVAEVLMGPGGLAASSRCGTIIDITTNHFDTVHEFHGLVADHGGQYLESPVLGSVVPASKGMLTVLASGPEKAYKAALPYLELIGANLFHLPEPGTATKMKLINNLVLGSLMATLAEAVSIAEDAGLTREQACDILGAGGGKSLVLDAKRKKLIDRDFSAHFSSSLIYKDLQIMSELAYEMRRPLYTGAMAKELFAEAVRQGMGDEDFSGVYRVLSRQ